MAFKFIDSMFRGVYHGKAAHPPDLHRVLGRAWDAGVERIMITGGTLAESGEALESAESDARLYSTVGVHPTRTLELENAPDAESYLASLTKLAKEGAARGKVVAIGECGLDYDRLQFSPKEVQIRWFERHFEVAQSTGLPMFLHLRAAAGDFVEALQRNRDRFRGGVVHSFTGTADEAQQLLSFPNVYIGINGCSLKTEENLQVLDSIPVERMMIETDAPWCDIRNSHAGSKHITTKWPVKAKEKWEEGSTVKGRNEPCHIRQVLEVIAGHKQIKNVAGLARMLYENTCRLFFPHDLDSMAGPVLEGHST
eukprot:jgi/Chlat1/1959/Chrsp157S02269